MPFPAKSTPYLLDALRSVSHFYIDAPGTRVQHNPYGFETDNNGSDDDDYWNAYGAQELDPSSSGPLSLSAKDADTANEDAYWARYSSVHGECARQAAWPDPLLK